MKEEEGDGGYGDGDGVKNGVIIHASGMADTSEDSGISESGGGGAGSTNCFISAAAGDTYERLISFCIFVFIFGPAILFAFLRQTGEKKIITQLPGEAIG